MILFLCGFIAAIAIFLAYCFGVCWWITKDPE